MRGRILTAVAAWLVVLMPAAAQAADAPRGAGVEIAALVPQGDGTVSLVVALDAAEAVGTTGVRLALPEGAAALTATGPDGWTHRLDGPVVDLRGTASSPGERVEVLVIARVGLAPGRDLVVPAVQRHADGATTEWSGGDAPSVRVTADAVDPSMTVLAPPSASGADVADLVVVTAGAVVLAVLCAWCVRRRSADA